MPSIISIVSFHLYIIRITSVAALGRFCCQSAVISLEVFSICNKPYNRFNGQHHCTQSPLVTETFTLLCSYFFLSGTSRQTVIVICQMINRFLISISIRYCSYDLSKFIHINIDCFACVHHHLPLCNAKIMN